MLYVIHGPLAVFKTHGLDIEFAHLELPIELYKFSYIKSVNIDGFTARHDIFRRIDSAHDHFCRNQRSDFKC